MSTISPSHGYGHQSLDRLPEELRPLFWDVSFEDLDFGQHRDFLTGRVLTAGNWDAICWLRRQIGDAALRQWIERRNGRGLTPKQLRFWELILGLRAKSVDDWLATRGAGWEGRIRR